MASGGKKIGDLYVAIGAKFDDLRKGLAESSNLIRNNISQIQSSSQQLRSFGKMASIVSGSIAAMGLVVMKTFGQFEQSMANVGSVIGATATEMQQLTMYARKMGAESVFTASQAADAMYYLALAGYDTKQTMAALKGTLDLAAATQYDLAETTRIVVSALSSFQLEAGEADRVSNVFAATISGSQASMDKLGNSFKYVAPVANAFGISLEQTAAHLGVLYNAGLEGSQAGTNLRQALLSLAKPTEAAQKALKKYGLTAEDISPVNNDLTQIIGKMTKAGMNNKTAMGDLATIFDKRAAPAMKILMEKGAPALEMLEKKFTGTTKASSMAAMQIDTFQGSMKLLKSALEETAIQFGDALAPALRFVVDGLKSLTMWFNNLPKGVKTTITVVLALVAAVGAFAGPVSLLLAMLPSMAAGIGMVGTALTALSGPIGITIAALAALAGVVALAISADDRRNASMRKMITQQKEAASAQKSYQQGLKGMADEFESLVNKQERSQQEEARLKEIHDRMRQEYPELISKTTDYAGAVNQIKEAGLLAADAINKLNQRQKLIAKAEMQMNIADANKAATDAMDDFESAITDNMPTLDSFKKGDKVFDEIFGRWAGKARENVGLLTKEFELKDLFPNIVEQIKKGNTAAVEQIGDMATKASGELARISMIEGADPRAIHSLQIITETLQEAAYAGAEFIKQQEALDIANKNLKEIDKAKQKAKPTGEVELTLEELEEQERIRLAKEEEEKREREEAARKARELADKRNALNLKLAEDSAKAEMDILKNAAADTLDEKLKVAEAEHNAILAGIDKENEDRTKKAREAGIKIADVEKTTNLERKAEEIRYNAEVANIRKAAADAQMEMEFNRIKSGESINQDELNSFRSMLTAKLDTLRAQGKAYDQEYMGIISRIKEIDDLAQSGQKKALKDIEDNISLIQAKMKESMDTQDKSAWQTQANELTNLLQSRLDIIKAMYGESSTEYLAALGVMRDHKKEIEEQMSADTKFWVDNFSEVIMSGFDNAMGEWVKSGSLAGIKMKDIFSDIGKAFREMVAKMVMDIVKSKIISLLTSVLGGGVGGFLPSPSLFNSAVGAETRIGGAQNLHPGEGVAAKVNRRSSDFYKSAAYAAKGIIPINRSGAYYTPANSVVIPRHIMASMNTGGQVVSGGSAKLHIGEGMVTSGRGTDTSVRGVSDSFSSRGNNAPIVNLTVNGAVVSDQRYWDAVYGNFIVPAINNSAKRYNS